MLLIGLTGSIATGKSTVASYLTSPSQSSSALPLIDADLLARRAVEPGTLAYRRIVSYFGPSTTDLLLPPEDDNDKQTAKGGRRTGRPLNRPALGRRVFGRTPSRVRDREKLNSFVHPMVRLYMVRSLLYHYLTGATAVLLDIPLLFESGLDLFCSVVMVVAVREPETQMRRLLERDRHRGLDEDDAKNRVASQVDVRVKAERAEVRNTCGGGGGGQGGRGYVLWNDGDKSHLHAQIDRVMQDVRRRSPRWWSWLLLACPPLMVGVCCWEIWNNYRARRWWLDEQARKKGSEEMEKPKL